MNVEKCFIDVYVVMKTNKPILITIKYKNGEKQTTVWHPFWGPKPNLKKAKEEGRLIEKEKHYEIIKEYE